MHERDRFELLSAYFDGEVTAAERQQIDYWLRTDLEVQRLYARVLQLSQKRRTIPTMPAQRAVRHRSGQFRLQAKSKMALIWCGTALVAVLLGSFLGVRAESQSPISMTQSPQSGIVLRKLLLTTD